VKVVTLVPWRGGGATMGPPETGGAMYVAPDDLVPLIQGHLDR